MSSTRPPTPALELADVHRHYEAGLVRALDGLSLVVEAGEWVTVTGPSGCGKSTMLHLVAALDQPTSGVVLVEGRDLAGVRDLASYRRRHIGLVFQLHNLLPQISASQNVEIAMFGTGLSRRQRRERAAGLLAEVDLAGMESRPPTKLSGGERQRVAIARALANEPDLLLADEPTGSLDERSVHLVLDLFARLRRERPAMTLVVVTHDPNVAAASDRCVYLRDGRVDRSGLQEFQTAAARGHRPGGPAPAVRPAAD